MAGMTKCVAPEWSPRDAAMNAISRTVAAIPTRRFAKPCEIAAAALFLAGPGAATINGENLVIDGGYTLT
jgi:NAD(P)-dependent dehydrogenase (short-subunit alcohol dehydrogenase family)